MHVSRGVLLEFFLGICRVVRAGCLDFNGVFGVRIMQTLIRLDLTQEFKGFGLRFVCMRGCSCDVITILKDILRSVF